MNTLLRDLDPAHALTDEQLDPAGERARAMLAEITATDPRVGSSSPASAPVRRRRPRLLPAVGLASALVVGGVVGPAALGLDSASAQWVAMPTGVSAADAGAAAEPCRDLVLDGGAIQGEPGWPTREQVRSLPVVLAEDRGSWRFVVLSNGLWEVSCLQQRSTLDRIFGLLGDRSAYAGGGGLTQLDGLVKPSAREVRTVDAMGSSVSGTLRAASTVSAITGRVGADVVGVVVEPVGHPKVTATVTGGWFAAWWPEPDTVDPASGAIPPKVALTVTLRDGTTVHYPVGSDQATAMAGFGTKS